MDQFHPIILDWFSARYGEPTDIQAQSWPRIAAGDHLLITAPTGSGKTLTAFLWTLNRFVNGELETGRTRVLYISPLKALNNDIRKNLKEPLAELRQRFELAGEPFPAVNVATRSGDTDPDERRQMLRRPPEILITTPESLNLLLTSRGGTGLLQDIDTVILDEIHGVVDSKRGVYLMSAIERLASLAGEFQRIALSATVNPLDMVARFVGGYRRTGDSLDRRQVDILASAQAKQYDIQIRYPETAAGRGQDEKVWDYLAEDLLPRIHSNQSTLVFVNSRALCEKLTFKINSAAGRIVAYAHHGSLSREIRTDVETRLKAGTLEAIVATSSLEMGIDIGALDEVILVQSPGSIASTIQRIGRAGHQVGAASRCTIYPTHPQDFVEAAVLSSAVLAKSLEPVQFISKPLDVLGQIIISMTAQYAWDLDELFIELRRSAPYHSLTRLEFDLVINMLMGRYADHHIRELKPRVRVDRTNNCIEALKGSVLSLYLSGGVIPDRGYYQLRHEGDNARIGELDEEFVWEANVGQVFSLGTQTWQIKKITHNDVIVGPGKPGASAPPFWIAESLSRSFHYSEKIGEFLEHANLRLTEDNFRDELIEEYRAEPGVADEIISFLGRQKEHTGCELPHRHHLLLERVRSGPGGATAGTQLVLHTGWGARVNRPFGMALEAAWEEEFGGQAEVFVANESIVVQLPHELSADDILGMVPADQLESLLRTRLEGSGFFGARFRESAGRALLLSKGRFNERKPLWMSRLQSQKLLDSVMKYDDFPILLETWRTCLQDEFDIDNLQTLLQEIQSRQITISETDSASPSPFAQSVAWDQINAYMYRRDTPKSGKQSSLSEDLLKEVVFSPGLRPAIAPALVDEFLQSRQRLLPGYEPADDAELEDWIKERSLIPVAEFELLSARLAFEPGGNIQIKALVVSNDDQERFRELLQSPEKDEQALEILIANWLQYYGPVTGNFVADTLQIPLPVANACLRSLTEAGTLIEGVLLEGDESPQFCDADNYEYLLRLSRARSRPQVTAQSLEGLAAFMFAWQTRYTTNDPLDRLYECLDRLHGLPATAAAWESDILPARLDNYETGHLDLLMQEGELHWIGLKEKTVSFCFQDDFELLCRHDNPGSSLIGDDYARYDFSGLLDKTGMAASELTEALWSEVWSQQISNDTVGALRQGISNDFKPADSVQGMSRRSRRAAFSRWRAAMPFSGNWYRLPASDTSLDAVEYQELAKERARMMLNRYGVVFRELCARETDTFLWRDIFRALRLMELSGEVVSGHFFSGVPGPQYMTPTAVRQFQEDRQNLVFHINATDPASPCGLGLGIHGDELPRRIPGNYLVYQGETLALVVNKRGRELTFNVEPDHDHMPRILQVLHHLAYRSFDPVRQLRIESINDQDAASSPYLKAIEQSFNLFRDYKAIVIQREL